MKIIIYFSVFLVYTYVVVCCSIDNVWNEIKVKNEQRCYMFL